ncbi:MAG: cytochrome c biogenesis CcdA family protein [bacterium]
MDLANPFYAYLAVFAAGVLSSFTPCTLSLFPLVIGYVGGVADGRTNNSFIVSLSFSAGIAVTFTVLGALAALTGTLLGNVGGFWRYVLAVAAFVMGLQVLGVIKLPMSFSTGRVAQKGIFGAFLMGLLFGLAASPCATPILAVVLAYVAAARHLVYGISLLFVYAIGFCLPVFLIGFSTGALKRLQNVSQFVHQLSGWLLILLGFYFLFSRQ